MKVVVAMDSFKGSLSSLEAGEAVKEGILNACSAEVVVKSLADGGEGTMEALISGLGGTPVGIEVTGPFGKKITARYGILKDEKTAVIEMAQAAGITLAEPDELDPWRAATYGVGELIADAVHRGCRNFIVGIGGSATMDGGTGMLTALGYEFLDHKGQAIRPGIQELDQISSIRTEYVIPELSECRFTVACDVVNPLCGENGSVYVFGPQKGVRENEKQSLDRKMKHYSAKTEALTGSDYALAAGAGAAGGLGFAFLSYLNSELKSGIEIVMDACRLEEEIRTADIVVTGEGKLDIQTAMGKASAGVAKLSKKYDKRVIAFAGSVTEDAGKCNGAGIDAFFPVVRGAATLEEAMEPQNAKRNIAAAAEQVFRLLSFI